MKNKIVQYLGLFIVSIFIFSCEDAYKIDSQAGEIGEDQIFQSVDDLNSYLFGDIYSRANNGNALTFTSRFTDELRKGIAYNGSDEDFFRFTLDTPNGHVSAMWLAHHRAVNRVNVLLQAAQNITPQDAAEEAYMNHILAQARVVRAYCYLELLSYFSPNLQDDSALGPIVFTDVPSIADKRQRSTNADAYALIIDDLNYAESNLDVNFYTDPDYYNFAPDQLYKFVNLNTVNALRARMYAYKGDYTNALTYATWVINNSGLTLSNQSTYKDMWKDQSQGEIIWASARPNGGGQSSSFYFNTTDRNGGAFWCMGLNLYNELQTLSGDIRGDVAQGTFIDPTSSAVADDYYFINKYPGNLQSNLGNDYKIIRLSEMYLIAAEAEANANNLNGVTNSTASYIKSIRDIRTNSNTTIPNYTNAEQAWSDVLKERSREFCYEGFRYVDLRRLGTLANKSIDRNVLDDTDPSLPLTIPNTDYRFTCPIPLDEVSGNPGITQNSGY